MKKAPALLLPWLLVLALGTGGLPAASEVPPARVRLLDHGINMPNLLHGNGKSNTFRTEDLDKLRAMGLTNVRIPVEIGYVLPGLAAPSLKGQLSTAGDVDRALQSLDQYLADFTRSGFAVTLALFMHDEFKSKGPDGSAAIMLQAMDFLTIRYATKFSPDQLFFDVNEPQLEAETWNKVAPELVSAIRKNAPLHTVIIEPTRYETRNFPQLKALEDPNIIYAMHIYWPSALTLQGQSGLGIKPDPDLHFPNERQTVKKLEEWMHQGMDWAAANKVPLVMNEFGCSSACDPGSREAWLASVRQIAETNHIPWSYWSFAGRIFGVKPTLEGGYDPCLVKVLSSPPPDAPAAPQTPAAAGQGKQLAE